MINFSELDVKDKSPVFNNGNAGQVVAKVFVEKRKPEDGATFPDWKIIFKDKDDRQLNEGFYYLDPSRYSSDEKFNARLNFEAKKLKHLVHGIMGKGVDFPVFEDTKEMLDGCMKMLQTAEGTTVNLGVTYGTTKRPNKKGYLQLKSTFPMITDVDTEISFNDNDLMEKPESVQEPTKGSADDLPWNKSK